MDILTKNQNLLIYPWLTLYDIRAIHIIILDNTGTKHTIVFFCFKAYYFESMLNNTGSRHQNNQITHLLLAPGDSCPGR